MFKKKPHVKPAAPLRSSDRRKLADSIIQEYQLLSIESTEESLTDEQKVEAVTRKTALRNSLFPENIQSARFTTTHGPELKQVSGTVYIGGQDARILWWQINGKTYPSIHTIWRHPDILALLYTPAIVVEKMRGGADLMTPGLANAPPFPARAKQGAVVTVADMDKPALPIAVGVCEIDIVALATARGARGVAVTNLHWAGDELFNFSGTGKPAPILPDKIEGWDAFLIAQESTSKAEDLSLEDPEEGGVSLKEETTATNGNEPHPEDTVEAEDKSQEKPLSQQEIDDAFRKAFLYGIYHHKSNNSPPRYGLTFPLNQSFVMSNLINPFLPVFSPEQAQQLQIKKTSWKNIKKFIKALDKQAIIKSKEQNGHDTVIFDIDFEDAAFTDFKPYKLPKKETPHGTSQGPGDKATEQIDVDDDSVGQKLEVKSFYKPTARLSPLFATSEKGFFLPAEVREIVDAYIEAESLASTTNKRSVKLDPLLANAVFDGSGALDKEVMAKGSIPRDALVDRVLHDMAPSYMIIRNGAHPDSVKAKSGSPPKILITLETRTGHKTVTKVSGLETYFVRPKTLADELRKTCAGSTSVEPLAGATKKTQKPIEEIMIQGPQKDAIVKALQRRGINPKWIDVLDKTKKK